MWTTGDAVGDVLRTAEGLHLRRWRDGDAGVVLDAFRHADTSRQSASPVTDLAGASAWIARAAADTETGDGFHWAVAVQDGSVVGAVAVSHVDRRHESGWVSYWTLPHARGRGVASSAARAAAHWALTAGGLHRLELGHRTNNPASCRVALAAGFAPEGVERAKLLYDGERFDVERHARLATDPAPPAA